MRWARTSAAATRVAAKSFPALPPTATAAAEAATFTVANAALSTDTTCEDTAVVYYQYVDGFIEAVRNNTVNQSRGGIQRCQAGVT